MSVGKRSHVWWVALGLLLSAAVSARLAAGQPSEDPLLYASDMVYLGAFRLPHGPQGISSFSFGGTAMTFRGANGTNGRDGSLFLVGNEQQQKVAEIAVPEVVNSKVLSQLKTAVLLQGFADVTRGNLTALNASRYKDACGTSHPPRSRTAPCGEDVKIGGLLFYGDRLIGTAYDYYDAGTPPFGHYSHFIAGADLSSRQFCGMMRVDCRIEGGLDCSRFVAGPMATIPSRWRKALGGDILTGLSTVPIIRTTSLGPSAFAIKGQELLQCGQKGGDVTIGAIPLLYYPLAHQNLGGYRTTNPTYNGSTLVKNVLFPDGAGSVLFIGRHGTGPYCYGASSVDAAKAFTCVDPHAHYDAAAGNCSDSSTDVTAYCYDPVQLDQKGPHAYPYVAQVWAYRAEDLVKAGLGAKKPYDVLPYAVWRLDLPFLDPTTTDVIIQGAAYDPLTRRLYLAQAYGDGIYPIVYVFKVKSPSV